MGGRYSYADDKLKYIHHVMNQHRDCYSSYLHHFEKNNHEVVHLTQVTFQSAKSQLEMPHLHCNNKWNS